MLNVRLIILDSYNCKIQVSRVSFRPPAFGL